MQIGQVVHYKGANYYVISVCNDIIEIAPTKHGQGSFMVHIDYVGQTK